MHVARTSTPTYEQQNVKRGFLATASDTQLTLCSARPPNVVPAQLLFHAHENVQRWFLAQHGRAMRADQQAPGYQPPVRRSSSSSAESGACAGWERSPLAPLSCC